MQRFALEAGSILQVGKQVEEGLCDGCQLNNQRDWVSCCSDAIEGNGDAAVENAQGSQIV